LIEVVLALGLCAFGIVALIGLFSTGVQANRESQDEIEAANVASYLVAVRTASPTNAITSFAIPPIPSGFSGGAVTNWIGLDGLITNSASAAAYRLVCNAQTNAMTGASVSQLYLLLTWPAAADPNSPAAKKYDLLTYIPLP
jgi:Tfp pilus assembly protein PilV